jgi:hypothetical protein
MSYQSVVRIIANATVNARDWEVFKEMVAETKVIVEKEGPDQVLLHECYFNPGSFNCLIIEAYSNEKAFLNHIELITPLSEKYKVDWNINRLELLGPYSLNVIEAMKQRSMEFSHFGQILQK